MSITVYGIPTCGTVKKAWRWLDAQGLAYERVNLRSAPPSAERVQAWVDALGAKALKNTSGRAYRALGPEKAEWTDAQWAEAFAQDPMLIKRPVVEQGGAAVSVGFKEPRYVELFGA